MSQTDDLEQMWQQSWARTQHCVADFWQGQAAYWQTVADVMARRAATMAEWYQGLPKQFQTLGASPSPAEFAAAFTRWQQQGWMAAWHLNADTQVQRQHLVEEWKKLAERNGFGQPKREEEKPVVKSSYYATHPQAAPQAKKAEAPVAQPVKTAPVPQPAPVKAAPTFTPTEAVFGVLSADYTPQPRGTFTPGPAKKPAPKPVDQPAEKVTAKITASAHQTAPAADEEVDGHTLPEPARNAAQAATLAGATSARRSVVASHRSRASRRSH